MLRNYCQFQADFSSIRPVYDYFTLQPASHCALQCAVQPMSLSFFFLLFKQKLSGASRCRMKGTWVERDKPRVLGRQARDDYIQGLVHASSGALIRTGILIVLGNILRIAHINSRCEHSCYLSLYLISSSRFSNCGI